MERFVKLFKNVYTSYAVKAISSQWRILYIMPIVISLGFIVCSGFEISLMPAYIGSLILIAGFLNEKEKNRKFSSIFSAVLVAVALPICLLNKGYRTVNYVKDFKNGFDCMKEHYVLAEHKGIDWDGADPLEVARKSESFKTASFADSENEAFYLALYAAGVGGDTVTVIGFTGPNGSAQGIGGIKLESGQLIFSNALLLDENGDVFIDSGVDYKSRNKIDIKVPLDENAIESLFIKGEDYLMKKAVDLFK